MYSSIWFISWEVRGWCWNKISSFRHYFTISSHLCLNHDGTGIRGDAVLTRHYSENVRDPSGGRLANYQTPGSLKPRLCCTGSPARTLVSGLHLQGFALFTPQPPVVRVDGKLHPYWSRICRISENNARAVSGSVDSTMTRTRGSVPDGRISAHEFSRLIRIPSVRSMDSCAYA